MKKSRFSETQIFGILKEVDAALKVGQVCRKHGINSATFYNWKSKYGGLKASDVKRIKELEDENARLKKMFADLSLENNAIKELIAKKGLVAADKRESAEFLAAQGVNVTHACKAVGLGRASYYRESMGWRKRDADVIDAFNKQIEKSPRAVFWKCFKRMR